MNNSLFVFIFPWYCSVFWSSFNEVFLKFLSANALVQHWFTYRSPQWFVHSTNTICGQLHFIYASFDVKIVLADYIPSCWALACFEWNWVSLSAWDLVNSLLTHLRGLIVALVEQSIPYYLQWKWDKFSKGCLDPNWQFLRVIWQALIFM